MQPIIGLLRKLRGRSAQSLVEYALTLALISVITVLVFQTIRVSVTNKLNAVISQLQ